MTRLAMKFPFIGKGLIWLALFYFQHLAAQQPLKVETFPFGILLQDRVQVDFFYSQWEKENKTLSLRGPELIGLLQEKASSTQEDVISRLKKLKEVQPHTIRPFWLANVIFFEGSKEAMEIVSAWPEVELAFVESHIETDDLHTPEVHAHSIPDDIELGLSVIGAPQMWELGYTGYGCKVLNIDSGILPDHPSYSDRYLGDRVGERSSWFDPDYENFHPSYCNWHGTHTLGTILGLDRNTHDTIGVAFRAEWMGAKATCPENTTQDLIATLQWAMNPDGNPGTVDDMPDVINNSWSDATLANECQFSLYEDAFTALEAVGIALVFSAGNAGPSFSSVTPPKNLNIDEVNTFTVGAVNGYASELNLMAFSSRGPSVCGGSGALSIKPEVVAPGFQIRSCHTDGGYRNRTGTSMAAPHVSGALLLLKEAFPTLSGRALKMALYLTALDLGPIGEDNEYGNGLINVYDAFQYLEDQGNTPTSPQVNYDIAIEDLILPNTICDSAIRPILVLRNNGLDTLREIRFPYSYDFGLSGQVLWEGVLAPDSFLTIYPGSAYTNEEGEFTLNIGAVLPLALGENALLDNEISRTFSYAPRSEPEVTYFPVCEGADAAIFAKSNFGLEVVWTQWQRPDLKVFEGSPLVLEAVEEEKIYQAGSFGQNQLGPIEPGEAQKILDQDSSITHQFDVYELLYLDSLTLFALDSGKAVIFLKAENGVVLIDEEVMVNPGANSIGLDWEIAPGLNYRLGVKSEVLLFRQIDGVSYPVDAPGILRLQGSSREPNGYGYCYNLKISHLHPCGWQQAPLQVQKEK